MATVTKTNARKLPDPGFDGVPYGNMTALQYTLETDSSGIMTASDQATAIAANDKIILGVIPGGTLLVDGLGIVSNVGQASTTGKFGFEYVDGVDDATVPEDDDYFHAALALDAQGRTHANNLAVAPVIIAKDAYLIMTNLVAAQDEAMRVDYIVYGVMRGRK